MKKSSQNTIKAFLFDLGGIVIDIDFNLVFSQWAKYSNCGVHEIKSRFEFDHYYEALERGEISSKEYFNSLRNNLEIDISDIQFEHGWNSIYKGEIPGISDLLHKIKESFPIYAFTNSNHLHQKVWSIKYANILSLFQAVFSSSDIGKRKPESEAFQLVADLIGVRLNEMVFYDDSIENINGAKKVGLNAVHVKTIRDIEESFKSLQSSD